jgi:hypothetical protein
MVKVACYAEGDTSTLHMKKNFLRLGEEPSTACGLPFGSQVEGPNYNIRNQEEIDCPDCRVIFQKLRMLR